MGTRVQEYGSMGTNIWELEYEHRIRFWSTKGCVRDIIADCVCVTVVLGWLTCVHQIVMYT